VAMDSEVLCGSIQEAIEVCTSALINGGKLIFCGNGGSAADSQHLAAEFVGRFLKDRRALSAIALTTDSSVLTCISNDYDYSQVFSRQVEGIASTEDVLIGISTSGNSINVIKAVKAAQTIGLKTVSFTGAASSPLSKASDICLKVPSDSTARIQEIHILLGHILCAGVENELRKMKMI
jgi:D-sedoheptulose 7-phosphate isomerase